MAEKLLGGRYVLGPAFAQGGMASVHVGRVIGEGGFVRTVAIKRLHDHFARNEAFRTMLLDEARLTGKLRHVNVVATLDAVADDGQLLLVLEYVVGENLATLLRRAPDGLPLPIVSALVVDLLDGLHAAHEATGEHGEPLQIIHRDVSPQNVLVGSDGVGKLLDFGIAKAKGNLAVTLAGHIKGKFSYLSPEQAQGLPLDRRTDIFSAGVVLWEALTGRRLFAAESELAMLRRVLDEDPPAPSAFAQSTPALDAVVLRALAKAPAARFSTAHELALALERAVKPASRREVAAWLKAHAAEALEVSSLRFTRAADVTLALDLATQPAARATQRVTVPLEALPAPRTTAPLAAAPVRASYTRWVVVVVLVAAALAVVASVLLKRAKRQERLDAPNAEEEDARPGKRRRRE